MDTTDTLFIVDISLQGKFSTAINYFASYKDQLWEL